MKPRAKLKDLPKSMCERAIFARKKACEDPSCIEVDDEMLPWVYCEEDGLWYSFDGNYSGSSPAEKAIKNHAHAEKIAKYEQELEERVMERYEYTMYWSKVRQYILERDNYTCQICGSKATSKLHIHHILKKKDGGYSFFDNLITVCPKCHYHADRDLYDPVWEKQEEEDK